jgi:F-type H+-transporting ATPase subunit b
MDAIIDAFGLDSRLIIIQIINFGILLVALVYFLYRPVLNLLKERAEKIEQGLKDAAAAAEAKTAADAEKQAVLQAAHAEAEAVAARAKTAADAKAGVIVDEAQAKAAQIVSSAEATGETMRQNALKESEKEVAQLALLAAEKILRERTN